MPENQVLGLIEQQRLYRSPQPVVALELAREHLEVAPEPRILDREELVDLREPAARHVLRGEARDVIAPEVDVDGLDRAVERARRAAVARAESDRTDLGALPDRLRAVDLGDAR